MTNDEEKVINFSFSSILLRAFVAVKVDYYACEDCYQNTCPCLCCDNLRSNFCCNAMSSCSCCDNLRSTFCDKQDKHFTQSFKLIRKYDVVTIFLENLETHKIESLHLTTNIEKKIFTNLSFGRYLITAVHNNKIYSKTICLFKNSNKTVSFTL